MPAKRHLLFKLPAILILPSLIFGLVYVSLAVDTSDFGHRHNLSRTGRLDNLQSSPPRMVTNGDTIAVVWSDGFEEGNPARTKDFGNIYLASARESDGYWRAKLKVFTANFSDWGANPDVVFQPNADIVHVVWAEGHDCSNTAPGQDCDLEDIKYRRCDVSGNINFCPASAQIIASGGNNISRSNPKIAVDDDGDLHVVWSQQEGLDNKIFYSRNGGGGWSFPSEVAEADAGEGQDPQLLASNGRLHLVWDDKGSKTIKHFFDADDDDDSLSMSGPVWEFTAQDDKYDKGQVGNPTIAGLGNWLFIAFDVKNPNDGQQFALFYTMSANNGGSWPLIYNIPRQKISPIFEHLFSPDVDRALKPSLVVTSTGTVTRVHAVWHERIQVQASPFPVSEYRIRFSDLGLTQPLNPTTPAWSTPISVTHILSPSGRATTDPNLIITDPALGGSGTGHITYLEKATVKSSNPASDDRQLDVFYEGGISGTIDPAYILDEFSGGQGGQNNPLDIKGATPTFIQLQPGQISGIREVLTYSIRFKNEGDLDAIGLGISDTLPLEVDFNNGSLKTVITPPPGAPNLAVYSPSQRQITWFGNVPAGTEVDISFTVTTNDLLSPPANVQNEVTMWNIGSGGAAIIDPDQPNCPDNSHTDCANTILAISIVYLPIIAR